MIGRWHPELSKHCPGTPVVLVGTKADKRAAGEDAVTAEEGLAAAQFYDMHGYVECSALDRRNVKDVFERAAHAGAAFSASQKSRCVVM